MDILEVWRWVAEESDRGVRLDLFLRDREPGPTRSQLKRLIEAGLALVDGEPARPAKKLSPGQGVELRIPPPEPLSAHPEPMDLDVRFEDEYLIVVNKRQGLVVHPAPGHPSGTLVNGLLHGRTTTGGDPLRPGIVHRLDKDTSGLIVVAKDARSHAALARQFHDHTIDRRYRVLVAGKPPEQGIWDTFHGRLPRDRKRFSSRVTRGRRAVSRFDLIERFKGAAMLRVTLETGRTHQVRVHCADHGYRVLGDPWYGPRR
ncbi:MAG: RluA family pseudouridine synthase, partial [Deltaproteobacteria bacterium]|nr:RluA family pseudouridine synthase [Deltaproteobacteria bacterium]